MAAAVLIGMLLTVVPPSTAVAAGEADPDQGPRLLHVFGLQGTNGYNGYALAGSTGAGEGVISLFLSGRGPSRTFSTVAYLAPASVTDDSIEADLGALGRFSVKLVPTGRMKRVRTGCGKERRWKRVEAARYEGVIEFHGEEGFTEVSATSSPLDFSFAGRIICSDSRSYVRGPEFRGGQLEVDRYEGGSHGLEMNVTKSRPGAKTSFSIRVVEERGPISIERTVGGLAPPAALRYDQDLNTATLRPPAPFSGQAAFRRNARPGNEWTGNLGVSLPGRADIPLAGPGFTTALTRP